MYSSPYSRTNLNRPEAAVGKILSKVRTADNGFSRNNIKPISFRNQHENRYNQHLSETVTLFDEQYVYEKNISVDDYYYPEKRPETGIFRPRIPQQKILPRKNFDHTLNQVNLEMMKIGETKDNSESFKKNISKIKTNNQDLKSNFQIKQRENLFRLFAGSVENILHWSRLKNNFQVLFEVTATLDNIQQGKWKSEKILYLSDSKTGPSLHVLYYEIDRPLPNLYIQSLVTCTGRLISRNRLHAFKVEEAFEEEKNASKRLAFICNRVAEEIFSATNKK